LPNAGVKSCDGVYGFLGWRIDPVIERYGMQSPNVRAFIAGSMSD
jgi:hypothetical protein